jgi:hypothetical protein
MPCDRPHRSPSCPDTTPERRTCAPKLSAIIKLRYMCPRLLFDYITRTKAGPAAVCLRVPGTGEKKGIYCQLCSVFFHPDHPITSHNIPSVHVPTTAWVSFRARLAHYLGQQHRILVAANEPYKAFPMSNAGSVAGLLLEITNNAFELWGLIDFTEGTRYVFQ